MTKNGLLAPVPARSREEPAYSSAVPAPPQREDTGLRDTNPETSADALPVAGAHLREATISLFEVRAAQAGSKAAMECILTRLAPRLAGMVARIAFRHRSLGSVEADLEEAGWHAAVLGIRSYDFAKGNDPKRWILTRVAYGLREQARLFRGALHQVGVTSWAGPKPGRHTHMWVELSEALPAPTATPAGALEEQEIGDVLRQAAQGMSGADREIWELYLGGSDVEGLRRNCAATREHVKGVIERGQMQTRELAVRFGWAKRGKRLPPQMQLGLKTE
jgi:hypothetical protein